MSPLQRVLGSARHRDQRTYSEETTSFVAFTLGLSTSLSAVCSLQRMSNSALLGGALQPAGGDPGRASLEGQARLAGEVRVCASLGWSKAAESLGPAARGRYDLTLRASLACAVDSCRDAKENPLCFGVLRAHGMNSHNADFITQHK